ncbi:interferon-inducible GTPase-domain-containing protein [Suillus discolor]|uniref:Interferon-inducible GTPase-domain-containing protein n=1 Tax=Suillus discolor TaxID=1912936 RepID=A0A9P7JNZ4_9AGAM|nr:interferon-inducible GTPase-domain-containing protein [Suillus discolor]KAG2094222.1 interferon-inducible GTPase-domain-containing protein [Suillus discolor]
MGASMSSPMQALRIIAGIVFRIVEEIRSSEIFENPTFANLAHARDSRSQRQANRAPMAGWQGVEWQEEDRIDIDTRGIREEIDEFPAARAPRATGRNVEEFHSAQTNVWRRPSEVGMHASEETPRRRLYETPERCAAVLQMKTKEEEGVSPTKSTNKGKKTLEKHSAFQLVSIPSEEEIQLAKHGVQYQEGLFHFAATGVSGAGKSSLINAFRGLRNRDEGAAPTGVVETTTNIARFPDPNPKNPFVWYDVPGSGTLNIPDWQYFTAQGLYVFDCIIILFDTRFTMTDLAMLVNCRRLNIPTYIVRSKSDSHIRNIIKESGYDSDEDEDRSRRDVLYSSAREQYIAETRATVRYNLQEAKLPDQRVYIVANSTMVSTVRDQKLSEKTIDELELMRDLFREAQSRRCGKESDVVQLVSPPSVTDGPISANRVPWDAVDDERADESVIRGDLARPDLDEFGLRPNFYSVQACTLQEIVQLQQRSYFRNSESERVTESTSISESLDTWEFLRTFEPVLIDLLQLSS